MNVKRRSRSRNRERKINNFKKDVLDHLSKSKLDILKYILSRSSVYRSYVFPQIIQESLKTDDFDVIREIICFYTNVKCDSVPLLLLAVQYNDIGLVRLLLEDDFDPNIIVDEFDISCLMVAVKRCNIDMVKLLLKHGADKTYKSKDGFTVQMIARRVGNSEIQDLIRL